MTFLLAGRGNVHDFTLANKSLSKNMELHDGFDVVLEGVSGKRFSFKVELLDKRVSSSPASSSTRINLKSLDEPGVLHLMTLPKPSITNKVAPPNRNNILIFENVSSDTTESVATFRIRTLFGKDSPAQANRSALYLTDSMGVLQAIEVVSEIEALAFSATIFKVYRAESSDAARTIEQVVLPRSFLNKVQLRRFVSEGYLHLPSLIPVKDIQAVRKLLHHQLGQVGSLVPGAIQGGNYGKFGGEMTNHPKLRELVVRTQLRNVLEELLGAAIFNMTNLSCQVAFRFPEIDDEHSPCPIDWHTDGERQGSSHPFTLLVGICLTDISEPYAGNLTVFPTSHWLMHRFVHHAYVWRSVSDRWFGCYV